MNTTYSKFLFFTGKGGVGKTSLACAIAIKIFDEGKRVILISTDSASAPLDLQPSSSAGFVILRQRSLRWIFNSAAINILYNLYTSQV
jgi:cellulose biosynthesis protein BcsQ